MHSADRVIKDRSKYHSTHLSTVKKFNGFGRFASVTIGPATIDRARISNLAKARFNREEPLSTFLPPPGINRAHAGMTPGHARRALWALSALWFAAILAAPGAELEWVYRFFCAICHQAPDRSWHLAGLPLPVCIRCTSIYAGFLAALSFRLPARTLFLRFALAAMVLEFVVARVWIDWEPARALSGLLFGLAAAGFVNLGVGELLARRDSLPRATATDSAIGTVR